MKFSALFVAAVALVSGAVAKDCCCKLSNNSCDCVSGYENNVNCASICEVRGNWGQC
nr:uncharacterized protein CTRU02_10249 [Colletotrichum truncatum]KAF6787453.1 hypothetical protein CTRU02_10249 [Colletotrichum truncatum]